MERYVYVIIFYLSISAVLLYTFRTTYTTLFKETRWYIFLFASFSIVAHVAISYFILTYVDRPVWPFSDRGTSFLLMNNYFVWAKPFDVFVQQLLLMWLITRLYANGFSLRQLITFFVVAFGSIHIFQILKTDVTIGLLFTLGALMLSVVCPYLLLRVRNGYVYNYMIHLGMYDLVALLAWLLY
jgi:hypothetical protein